MAYAPNPNLFNPRVMPDTQGMGPGLAAVGQSLAQGIEKYASNRAAVKAADSEFDMFQSMYPDTAALMDGEKFASANLAGKQKMLGLAKGYIIEQREQLQNAQTNSFRGAELGLRERQMDNQVMQTNQSYAFQGAQQGQTAKYQDEQTKLDAERLRFLEEQEANRQAQIGREEAARASYNTITFPNGGSLMLSGDGRVLNKEAKVPSSATLQDMGGGVQAVVQDGKVITVIKPPKNNGVPRYVELDGTGISIPVDGNGNRNKNLPFTQKQTGPFKEGLTKQVPYQGTISTPDGKPPRIQVVIKDGVPYRVAEDGKTLIKFAEQDAPGTPGAVDPLDKVFE